MANANYRQIGGPNGLLAKCFTFNGNTMRAMIPEGRDRDLDYLSHCGQLYLHSNVQTKMREDAKQGLEACYVVWSYTTPIAWLRSDGVLIVPDVKYSVTTTRQQGMCRAWLAHESHNVPVGKASCNWLTADKVKAREEYIARIERANVAHDAIWGHGANV